MALAFDHITDALAPKRLQIVVHVGQLAQQERDISRLGGDGFAVRVENLRFTQHRVF